MNRGIIRPALTLWDEMCRGRWLYSSLSLMALSVLILQCAAVPQATSPCDHIHPYP